MSFLSNIKFILNHPLNKEHKTRAFLRFVKWQIRSRLNQQPVTYEFTDKAKLVIQKGMTGATGNLYCGLHEFNDMGFLLHLLRKEDYFVDVRANIGSYTILASAHAGANSIAIEPILSTFGKLKNNIAINQLSEKVKPLNMAVGSKKGEIGLQVLWIQ